VGGGHVAIEHNSLKN